MVIVMAGSAYDRFGKDLFTEIDFTGEKQGIVVGNTHLETEGYIEVFLYELFVGEIPREADSQISEYEAKANIVKQVLRVVDKNGKEINYNSTNHKAYDTGSKNISINEDSVTRNNVYTGSLRRANYIKVYPKIYGGYNWYFKGRQVDPYTGRRQTTGSRNTWDKLPDTMKNLYKPKVGSRVLVEFINADPKYPIFKYAEYMTLDPYDPDIDPDNPIDSNINPNDNNQNHDVDNHKPKPNNVPDDYDNWREVGYGRMMRLHPKPYLPMSGDDVKKYKLAIMYAKVLLSKDNGTKDLVKAFPVFPEGTYDIYDESTRQATLILQTIFKITEKGSSFEPGMVGPITFDRIMNFSGFDKPTLLEKITDPDYAKEDPREINLIS